MDLDEHGAPNSSEVHDEPHTKSNGMKLGDYIPIYIPAIERGLLNHSQHEKKERFLDFLKARPSNSWFLGVLGRTPPSDSTIHDGRKPRFRVPFVRKINWGALWKCFKQWIKGPEHIALFIWLLFVAGGLILLFLVMTGLLDQAVPNSNIRKDWAEIINQILNALFTMMALYEHPKFFHHLILLLRWRCDDGVELRKVYCKNGVPKPNEWAHMIFVVLLLHITCFSQYALCGLYWGYTRTTRPEWAENFSIGLGIVAPVLAAAYTMYSPLSRTDDEPQAEEEDIKKPTKQVDPDPFNERITITSPEWIGGVFDCSDDTTVTCLSFFCTFCVFGWNVERLGFGNMYVHMITFALLCTAPFWIFAISALNVKDDTIKLILVITGSVLCVFGLLYGGFWRAEMRKKFKLPGNPICCFSSTAYDYIRWLFCWPCSLAQEVRTANFYDIEDDGFYRKVTDKEGKEVLIALPSEGNLRSMESLERSRSCPATAEPVEWRSYSGGVSVESQIAIRRASTCPKDSGMAPPRPPLIAVEEERPLRNVELSERTSQQAV